METAMIQSTEFETTQATDPREAKLREVIVKGKASLHKATSLRVLQTGRVSK